MKTFKKFARVCLLVGLFSGLSVFAGFAHADDDSEMTTESKKAVDGKPVVPATDASAAATSKGKPIDPGLRALVRKAAPFWIEDGEHGTPVRINKDGSFSAESQGGGAVAGQWKAIKGELQMNWSDGGDAYTYPVTIEKKSIVIKGVKAKKGRYLINP